MKTLSAIESFTGGLFAKTIADKPGASKFFKGALVTYANEAKEILGVNTANGVYNKETALAMAIKGKEYFNTNICVSFTGVAGPDEHDGVKPGTIFIGINNKVFKYSLKGSRSDVRKQAVELAWNKIEKNFLK